MNRIKSFTINHNVLVPGFYISREDGDVITYDLRTRKPNAGDYMDNASMHSLEHMFATYIRNSKMGEDVVYFGPMGCQTGFYLLVRSKQSPKEVFAMTKEVLQQIIGFSNINIAIVGCWIWVDGNTYSYKDDLKTLGVTDFMSCH